MGADAARNASSDARHPRLEPLGPDPAVPGHPARRPTSATPRSWSSTTVRPTRPPRAWPSWPRASPACRCCALDSQPRLRARQQRRHRAHRSRRATSCCSTTTSSSRRATGCSACAPPPIRPPTSASSAAGWWTPRGGSCTPAPTSCPTLSGDSRSARAKRDLGQFTERPRRRGHRLRLRLPPTRGASTRSAACRSTTSRTSRTPTTACAPRAAACAPRLCGDVTLVHDEHGSTQDDGGRRLALFQPQPGDLRPAVASKLAGRALRPRSRVAVDHELPDRLRHQLARSGGRARHRGRPGQLPLRLRPRHRLPASRAGGHRRLPAQRHPRPASSASARRSPWSTARATSSIAIAAGARSASPCSRSTAFPATGSGRRTRWTRSGCRPSSTARVPRVRTAAADPHDPARRRHRPLPSRRCRRYATRPASSSSSSAFEWGERKEPWLLLRAFNDTFRAQRAGAPGLQGDQRRPRALSVDEEIRRLGLRYERRPDLLPLQPRVPALPARRRSTAPPTATSRSAAARAGTCR